MLHILELTWKWYQKMIFEVFRNSEVSLRILNLFIAKDSFRQLRTFVKFTFKQSRKSSFDL